MDEILINSNSNYNIYKCSIPELDTFFLAIPTIHTNKYSLYMDIPNKDLRYEEDSIIQDDMQHQLVSLPFNNILYVLPVIPKELIPNKDNTNDNILYKELEKIIISLSNNIFNKFIKQNKQLEQSIYLIISTDYQEFFTDWLSINSAYRNNIKVINNIPKMIGTYIPIESDGGTSNSMGGHGMTATSKTQAKPKIRILTKKGYVSFSLLIVAFLVISIVSIISIILK